MQHPHPVMILLFLFLEMIMVASKKTDKDLGYIEKGGRILPSPSVLAGINTTLAHYLSPRSGYLIATKIENLYFIELVSTVNYILVREVRELEKMYPKAVRQLKGGITTVAQAVYDLLQRVPSTSISSWRDPEHMKKLLSRHESTYRRINDNTPLTKEQMSDLERKYIQKVLVTGKPWLEVAISEYFPDTITHYTMAKWFTECCFAALNGNTVDEGKVMVAVKILLLIYFPNGRFYVHRETVTTTTASINILTSIARATTTASTSSFVAKYGKVGAIGGVALLALGLLGGLMVLIPRLQRPMANALSNRTALQVTTEGGGVTMNLVLVGVLAFGVLLLVVVIICWRRRGKRAKSSDAEDSEKNPTGRVRRTGATGSPPSLTPYSSRPCIDDNNHSPLFRQLAMKKRAAHKTTTTDRLPWSVPPESIHKERSNINVRVKVRSAMGHPHWRG